MRDVDELARELCRRTHMLRLRRIGEPMPENPVPFDGLPQEDQDNWRTLAEVVLDRDSDPPPSDRFRELASDYDRYTRVLGHDPGWRDEMRRAVIVEMRAELDRLAAQSADPLRS